MDEKTFMLGFMFKFNKKDDFFTKMLMKWDKWVTTLN